MLGIIGLLTGLLGAALYFSQRSRVARDRPGETPRRMPKQWPLNPRAVVNSNERRVWHWLHETFPHHEVIPKLPLTRFTQPRDPEQGREWFEMLSTAYCSFTICTLKGEVIGCVDVPGPRGLSRGNKHLKHTLLGQCGIGYWLMTSDALPNPESLRIEFLGASEAMLLAQQTQPADLTSVRNHLHQALDRGRELRQSQMGGLERVGADSDVTPWPQSNSFLGTLDTHRGGFQN
ncbi:MAG: DUF2726 domain-containing protein [Ottowia sp.]|nr:DUF2726 domain-containing protein [Ottowia sp.]